MNNFRQQKDTALTLHFEQDGEKKKKETFWSMENNPKKVNISQRNTF